MFRFKIIFLICFLLAACKCLEVDEAPETCALTDLAKERITSGCFSQLQNVIACMSPSEQDTWAQANKNNTDTTKCFNCAGVKTGVKEGFKKQLGSLGNKLTTVAQNKRKGFSCFKKFGEQLEKQTADEIDSSLESMVAYQKQGSQCHANLVQKVQNLMIQKRKLLCVSTTDMQNMSVSATDGAVTDFKYTIDEARSVVNEYLTFFDCQASSSATIVNQIATVADKIANSTTCALNTTVNSNSNPKIPNGKGLGTDVLSFVAEVSNLSTNFTTNFTTAEFSEFTTSLNNTFNGVNAINCNPGGFQAFLANIDNSGKSPNIQKLLNQSKGKCKDNFSLFVKDGQFKCEGECDITSFTLSFKDNTKVPKNYHIAVGCTSIANFAFYTYTDLVDSTVVYSSFMYKGSEGQYTSDVRCLQKAVGCLPGGTQSGGDASDGDCSNMNTKCKTDLNSACSKSGLLNVVNVGTGSSPYPADCDAATLGLDSSSNEFVRKCFLYLYGKFFRKGINMNPQAAVTAEETLANDSEENSAPRTLRYLETSLVVDTDSTVYPVTFSDVLLTSSDITVDSGSIQSGIEQIVDDALNGKTLKLAFGLLLTVVAFLI